jgi:hypothetical protein
VRKTNNEAKSNQKVNKPTNERLHDEEGGEGEGGGRGEGGGEGRTMLRTNSVNGQWKANETFELRNERHRKWEEGRLEQKTIARKEKKAQIGSSDKSADIERSERIKSG